MKQFKRKIRSISIVLLAIPLLFLAACGSNNSGNGGGKSNNEGGNASNYSGTVTFGDAQWDSVELHTWIARTILEKGYGVKTDVKTGTSPSVLLGLKRNDIQVLMEAWKLSYAGALQEAADSGKIKIVSVNFDDDTQGLYVPKYMIEGDPDRDIEPITPDLKSVKQLPKYWKLFKDPKDKSKGRIIGAPSGYVADQTLQKKMKAYNLDETYNYFTPGSKTALVTSLDKAYRNGDPWVGYGWTPTEFAAKYHLVLLKEPKYTEKCWSSDMGCAFPKDDVTVPVNSDFAKKAPKIVDFLSQYKTGTKVTNEMLRQMGEYKDNAKQKTAKWWLKNNDMWEDWVPNDVAENVKKALQ